MLCGPIQVPALIEWFCRRENKGVCAADIVGGKGRKDKVIVGWLDVEKKRVWLVEISLPVWNSNYCYYC